MPLALLAVAGVIGGLAVADHRWKQRRIDAVQVDEWYCSHRGTRCGGASSAAIERRWNERQLGYEIVVSALGAAALALAAFRGPRR
jgi:hypothetical protein